MTMIINDVVEMRNFTSEAITVTESYTLPGGVKSAIVEIWAAGDFSSSTEYIISKVDGIQIGGQLRTGYDDSVMRAVITYDLTSLIEGKQIIELSITTTSAMNPNVGVSGGTSCWVDWRFTFELYTTKILIEDGTEVKSWNAVSKSYEKIGNMPLTEEMFSSFGMYEIPKSLEGIINDTPKLHLYTEDVNVINSPTLYSLKLEEKKLALPRIVLENTGRILEQNISSIVIDDILSGTGDLQYVISKDKIIWYAFDKTNMLWQVVDITYDVNFREKGMRKEDFVVVTESHYGEIFQAGDDLYLAVRFLKGEELDICKFKGVRINYTAPLEVNC
ncbi:MAG: hypothetical protein FH751_12670 [Firmicutes bacterium]|nr:hypothetical protein [Bacillota bacterium]